MDAGAFCVKPTLDINKTTLADSKTGICFACAQCHAHPWYGQSPEKWEPTVHRKAKPATEESIRENGKESCRVLI